MFGKKISDKIEREKLMWKERYDKSRLLNVKFHLGDIVAVRSSKVASGESTKSQATYKGPLVITQILPSDKYRVQSLAAKGDSKRATTAHVSQIKIWSAFNSVSDDESSSDESEPNVSEQSMNVNDNVLENTVSDELNLRRKRIILKPRRLIEE